VLRWVLPAFACGCAYVPLEPPQAVDAGPVFLPAPVADGAFPVEPLDAPDLDASLNDDRVPALDATAPPPAPPPGTAPPTEAPAPPPTAPPAPVPGAQPRPSSACGRGAPALSGAYPFSRAGASGSYELRMPPSAGPAPPALVLNLHGYPGSGLIEETSTQMTPVATARGFVLVYPDALGGAFGQGWSVGGGFFNGGGRDDVAFFRALIEDVGERTCVDLARVFVTGHSAGGFMTYRLACELSDVLTAVAPVAGAFVYDPSTCRPSRPISMLHIHGTADTRVPYDASSPVMQPPGGHITPARDSIRRYAEAVGCAGTTRPGFSLSDWACETYEGCPENVEVTFCTVTGMGHVWPGGDPNAGFGAVGGFIVGPMSNTLDAGEFLWDEFFSAY
jgi:polyhydroxybutyrate depolymerase